MGNADIMRVTTDIMGSKWGGKGGKSHKVPEFRKEPAKLPETRFQAPQPTEALARGPNPKKKGGTVTGTAPCIVTTSPIGENQNFA